MTEDNDFYPVNESELEDILFVALTRGKEDREAFVREKCDGDPGKYKLVMEVLVKIEVAENAPLDIELEAGEQIGDYIIIEEINKANKETKSRGGFATVYLAENKDIEKLAAVKVFNKSNVNETEKLRAWKKDFKSLAKFDHDNIVKFYSAGFYKKDNVSLPYIVEEFIKGVSMNKYCSQNDLKIRDILGFFINLCQAIEYIHEKEIFHLDLKPDNIMVTKEAPPRIKVLDFGSSKLARKKSYLTRSDLVAHLSVKFAAPELLKDEEPNNQSDIYSLGAILYLLLTGKVPFGEGEKDREKIKEGVKDCYKIPLPPSKRVLESEAKPGHNIKRHSRIFKGDLDAIIMKSLAKQREERYKTVSDFRADIENFLAEKPVTARKLSFYYKFTRFFFRLLKIKRDADGWNKWTPALLRLFVVCLVLSLFAIASILFFERINSHPVNPKFRIEKRVLPLRVRTNDQVSDNQPRNGLFIKKGEDNYFSLMEIPTGCFQMGRLKSDIYSSEAESKFLLSPHSVNVNKFYMNRFEITRKQWNLIAASPKIRLDLETVNVGTDDEFLPMTYITYPQVQEFCERFSRDLSQEYGRSIIVRLPTEAEWEYSCRAGSETRFGGGNSEDKDFANTENLPAIDEGNWKGAPKWAKDLRKLFEGADNFRLTRSISKFDANPFGLAAMNGNVWEMVSDSWHEDFKSNAPTGGSAWEKVDARNPAHSQKSFVLKGGAFSRDTYMAQCSYRALGTMTTQGNEQTGFRIVIEAEAIDDLFPSNAPLK